MKKLIAIIVSISYLAGCSCFAGSRQKVSVMTNVENAKIYANGELVGKGNATFKAKRNRDLQLVAKADGYDTAHRNIDTELSATGILDIIGIFLFLLPGIGLFFPGSKTLEQQNVYLELKEDK